MADKVFADGVRIFPKRDSAPEWVIADLVLTPEDLTAWAKANPTHMSDYKGKQQLRLQLTKSQDGKVIASVNTYKREEGTTKPSPSVEDQSDLPF